MKITIIGASGHGRVVADVAHKVGYDEIEFLDDNAKTKFCGAWPVVGKSELAANVRNDLFIAIGNSKIRKLLMERFAKKNFPVLIHPAAIVAEDVEIGAGSIVMAGAVINPGAKIGRGCIVSINASIDHDCKLGDYVHAAVGSSVGGGVEIGDNVSIGTGAVIDHNLKICADCVISAGAVVLEDNRK